MPIPRVSPDIQAHRAANIEAATLAAHAGSGCATAAVAMLNTLISAYRIELESVAPERLVHVQTALKQCAALRDVFSGARTESPKI